MSNSIISVTNLAKCYMIGRQLEKGDGLRHVLERAIRAPFGWLRPRKSERRAKTEEFWALRDLNIDIEPPSVI